MYGLLIAEDELIERMVLKKTLEKRLGDQCRIFEAQNGREALEIFQKEDVRVVILDIAMPGMNGIEAAEAIRKESPDCCLIFLTAYDRFEYARKAVSVRAMEYLLKPYSQREVVTVVEEALRLTASQDEWRKLRRRAQGEENGQDEKKEPGWAGESKPPAREEQEKDAGEHVSRLSLMADMVQEYIRKNYMKEISMSDGARAVNYSEPYFCKMFKLQFGQNFTSYVAEYRINEAKKLLTQPNVNVKEVGERVGYSDSNYFTKVFKRMTGESPSEYRNHILKELHN